MQGDKRILANFSLPFSAFHKLGVGVNYSYFTGYEGGEYVEN